jgi:hypothetical protein
MRKRAAQLDREIAEALSRRRPRRHHSSIAAPSADEIYTIATDLLLELEQLQKRKQGQTEKARELTQRFHTIHQELRDSYPDATPPEAFWKLYVKVIKPKRTARVIEDHGQGGFMDPPGYPTHTHRVESDLRRAPHNRGSTSVSYAAEDKYIDPDTRQEIRALLSKWKKNRPPITAPEVQAWVLQVLGYFRNAYGNPTIEGAKKWDASNLVFDNDRDPVKGADDHAGVHLIRKFYPEFSPTRQDFTSAGW